MVTRSAFAPALGTSSFNFQDCVLCIKQMFCHIPTSMTTTNTTVTTILLQHLFQLGQCGESWRMLVGQMFVSRPSFAVGASNQKKKRCTRRFLSLGETWIHHTAKQSREKTKTMMQDYSKIKDHNACSRANKLVWHASRHCGLPTCVCQPHFSNNLK